MAVTISRNSELYRQLRSLRSATIRAAKRWHGVHRTSYIHPSCTVSRDLHTEEYVFMARECWVAPRTSVGRYTLFGPRVAIVGDDHITDAPAIPMHFSGRPPQRSTVIGRDVWVGYGAIIRRGVSIGDGSIVAAGAVVTKNVPAYEIWAGVPARKVRDRFDSTEDVAKHVAMLEGPLLQASFAETQETVQ